MSRKAAAITQADVARALRAAKQVGPEWVVEVRGDMLRFRQGWNETGQDPSIALPDNLMEEHEPELIP